MVASSYYLSRRGPLGWRGRCTGVVRLPHLHVMGVWGEQPLDVILRGGPHLPVDGGAVSGSAWCFLVWEWTCGLNVLWAWRESVRWLVYLLAARTGRWLVARPLGDRGASWCGGGPACAGHFGY